MTEGKATRMPRAEWVPGRGYSKCLACLRIWRRQSARAHHLQSNSLISCSRDGLCFTKIGWEMRFSQSVFWVFDSATLKTKSSQLPHWSAEALTGPDASMSPSSQFSTIAECELQIARPGDRNPQGSVLFQPPFLTRHPRVLPMQFTLPPSSLPSEFLYFSFLHCCSSSPQFMPSYSFCSPSLHLSRLLSLLCSPSLPSYLQVPSHLLALDSPSAPPELF